MKQLFAVIRTFGPAWQDSLPMEKQRDWEAHARFMDALQAEGFVVLGGPLLGTRDVLLVIRAENSEEIIDRLATDPWTGLDLLSVSRIAGWNLRLGSLN
jgi:hypothetical protein